MSSHSHNSNNNSNTLPSVDWLLDPLAACRDLMIMGERPAIPTTMPSSGHLTWNRNDAANSNPNNLTTTSEHQQQQQQQHQGMLWKRRDVFKNRWRPRWFVLQPHESILVYYIVVRNNNNSTATTTNNNNNNNNNNNSTTTSNTTENVEQQPNNNAILQNLNTVFVKTPSTMLMEYYNHNNNNHNNSNSDPLAYDVAMPRGTIDLMGCTVTINDTLSRQDWYVFSIQPPPPRNNSNNNNNNNNATTIHLAAPTQHEREMWVQQLTVACAQHHHRNHHQQNQNQNHNRANGRVMPSHPAAAAEDDDDDDEEEEQRRRTSRTLVQELALVPNGDTPSSNTSTTKSSSWTTLGNHGQLGSGLSESMQNRIHQAFQDYLHYVDREPSNNAAADWNVLVRHETITAYQRKWTLQQQHSTTHLPMSVVYATMNHSPSHIFHLLVNCANRPHYESSVRSAQRLQILNDHTFLDQYELNAIWPSSPREFTVLTHWRVFAKGPTNNERAIALISFSCPEASALKVKDPTKVRANLIIHLSFLQPIVGTTNKCRYVRVLSVDWGSGMSNHVANLFMSQQAIHVPTRIDEYLQSQHQRTDAPLFDGANRLLTDDRLAQQIVHNQTMDSDRPSPSQRRVECRPSMVIPDDDDDDGTTRRRRTPQPSVEQQGLWLFLPLVVHRMAIILSLTTRPVLWFLVSAFLVIRHVTKLHLGKLIPSKISEPIKLLGPMTCRFSVDLKGILRYISNKAEERKELKRAHSSDVSVVHIVACAVACAYRKERQLHVKRVQIPWLWIDELVENDDVEDAVQVSISENGNPPVLVHSADLCDVQHIADAVAKSEQGGRRQVDSEPIGSCLIVSAPNYGQVDMETDVVPTHPDIRVVAVIGGLSLARDGRHPNGRTPRPMLALSLTIVPVHHNDFILSRRLAEEVQKLLQFPEMCDQPPAI